MKAEQSRILLTGAAGGIGRAAALALGRAGASLMLTGRSAARLSAQARSLAQSLPAAQIEWRQADLQGDAGIRALAAEARDWNCNVLIHCAGAAEFGRFDDMGAAAASVVLNTNLLAPMLLTQAMLAHFRSLPRAQVICVGSVLGAIGLPGYAAYCASKFGLRGFTQALRRELSQTTVRVQYLGPRSTRTAFNDADVLAYNRFTRTAMDPADLVARALVQMLQTETKERFLGFPEKLAARINGLVPTLLDGAFAKHESWISSQATQVDFKEMKNEHF